MAIKLIIAEKPSVARDIAGIIGQSSRHNGFIEAKGYTVTWAVGHLVTLADAHDYDMLYKKWNMADLPIIPKPFRLKIIPSSKDQYKTVSSLLKQAEEVIVATDAGREGQLIYELIALSVGYKGIAKRLWLSSMTEDAIRQAMKQLKDNAEYKNLYHAGFARAQADWLTGINATRAMTMRAGTLLTIGRVQTPTLAMIVQREAEIDQFTPEPYFEVEASFTHENGEYRGKWFDGGKQNRFDSELAAEDICAKVTGQPASITNLVQKVVHEQPPQLFDLTSLQRQANQKYGFTADETLKLAQSLYETYKVLTYPRTDSRYLSEDIVATLPQRLSAASQTFPELITLIPASFRPTKRVVNSAKVTDHHAILPTEKSPSQSLSNRERKIYELVAKQTVAALLDAAQWASTTIETSVVGERFKTTGRMLVNSGWRAVFGANEKIEDAGKRANDDEMQSALPMVTQGDAVTMTHIDMLSKHTKPPAHFTEASLLAAMESAGKHVDDETLAEALKERGIGTPATRATIIEKIKRDGYIRVQKKNLLATDKGRALIDAIHVDVLKSPELTGEWEHHLSQIEAGRYSVSQFIGEITTFTRTVVESIKETTVLLAPEVQLTNREVLGTCPICGGEIVETKKSYGCTHWQTQGCKFAVWKQICGHRMTKSQAKELLVKKRTKKLKFKNKAGEMFEAQLVLHPDGKVVFAFNDPPH